MSPSQEFFDILHVLAHDPQSAGAQPSPADSPETARPQVDTLNNDVTQSHSYPPQGAPK